MTRCLVTVAAWLALGLCIVCWMGLALADRYGLGTVMAFGPRWLLLFPVAALAIPALVLRRAIVPLGVAAGLTLGPVMGFCVPWGQALSKIQTSNSKAEGTRQQIRILTCNTLGGRAEVRLGELIEREHPDVVALQEWPSERPPPVVFSEGWQAERLGGIVIASRLPIIGSNGLESPARRDHIIGLHCELLTRDGPVQFFALHLLTPRTGLEAVLEKGIGGLDELDEVTAQRQLDGAAAEAWMDQYSGPKLVAGDFNLTPESTIYRRRFGYLQNAFSTAGWGYGGTKFTRMHSVRIDHVLADEQWLVLSCRVGPNVGSDHRPVVAEVERQN